MFENMSKAIVDWNRNTSDKQKLQHAHLVLLSITVLLAGLASLFSVERSQQLTYVSLALITTFVVNFLVWSVLKAALLDKLPKNNRTTRR